MVCAQHQDSSARQYVPHMYLDMLASRAAHRRLFTLKYRLLEPPFWRLYPMEYFQVCNDAWGGGGGAKKGWEHFASCVIPLLCIWPFLFFFAGFPAR